MAVSIFLGLHIGVKWSVTISLILHMANTLSPGNMRHVLQSFSLTLILIQCPVYLVYTFLHQQGCSQKCSGKTRIILPLKEVRRFHVYVMWYDICMVRCIA